MKEALFYKQEDGKIRCLLCPKECKIAEGKRGFCQARENIKGKLYALTFGECSSVSLDPIEKKPLYIFILALLSFLWVPGDATLVVNSVRIGQSLRMRCLPVLFLLPRQ